MPINFLLYLNKIKTTQNDEEPQKIMSLNLLLTLRNNF